MHLHLSPFKRFRHDHVVAVFDTPGQFLDTLNGLPGKAKSVREMSGGRDSFYGGESWEVMSNRVSEGREDVAKRAAALLAKINAVSYATPKRKRVASPFGRVSVGNYLASDPLPCRRKVKEASHHAPLSIVVSLTCSAYVRADTMERRGIAIAALIRRLASERPVNLYLSGFADAGGMGKGECCLVKFPTTPIDTHRLAYLVSSQGFGRGALFAFYRSAADLFAKAGKAGVRDVRDHAAIHWPGNVSYSQKAKGGYAKDLQDFFGHDVLYIPGAGWGQDSFDEMEKDPVAWINATMEALTNPDKA